MMRAVHKMPRIYWEFIPWWAASWEHIYLRLPSTHSSLFPAGDVRGAGIWWNLMKFFFFFSPICTVDLFVRGHASLSPRLARRCLLPQRCVVTNLHQYITGSVTESGGEGLTPVPPPILGERWGADCVWQPAGKYPNIPLSPFQVGVNRKKKNMMWSADLRSIIFMGYYFFLL